MNKLYLLLAFALLFGAKAFAQTPQRFFERHYIDDLIFMNESDLLVLGADKTTNVELYKVDVNGEVVNSVVLPSLNANNSLRHLARFNDGSVGILVTKYTNDTMQLQKMTVHDDLSVDTMNFNWVSYDFYNFLAGGEQWVEDAMGNFFYSYYVDTLWTNGHHGLRIQKFDGSGNLLTQKLLNDPIPSASGCYMFPTPDMMGCRVVLAGWGRYTIYNCYTLDNDLNTVAVKENVDHLTYPVKCVEQASFRVNPYNGRTYTINCQSETQPDCNGNPVYIHEQDILMGMFDADNFEQMAYTWGITTPTQSYMGMPNSIDFDENGDVYMVGGMDGAMPTSLYIVHLDEDLNKLDEIYYRENDYRLMYNGGMRVSANGDVFVNCMAWKLGEPSTTGTIYKVPREAFTSVDEAHAAGFAVAIAYPNPGGSEMHIRTAVENAAVEVYDMNGRLVARQPVTETETVLDATDWAAGTYVWKVVSTSCRDVLQNVSTQTVHEIESGKWMKK